jgi:choline-sulfatase
MKGIQMQPNILFLLSDEHSYRFLSARSEAQGGEPCRTPTLDGLIERGSHFETAYCQYPLCVPSRVAMLSGRPSSECAVLCPGIPTIASYLGDQGYATATVGKMHLIGSRQMAGFQHRPYGDFTAPSPAHQKDPLGLTGPRDHIFMPSVLRDPGVSEIPESLMQEQIVTREATAWLREQRFRNPDRPWFLMTSFAHPHFPMNAARRFFDHYYPDRVTSPRVGRTGDTADHPLTLGALRSGSGESQGLFLENVTDEQTHKARAAYFACVDQFDEMLGDFLAILDRDGFLDNTVIVYTSDHGELAGEHGLWFKRTWHEASIRVPLIISTPEHRSGDVDASEIVKPVSLGDLFPTFCGFAGIDPPGDLNGVDLSGVARGGQSDDLERRGGAIIENLAGFAGSGTEYRAIRADRYKVVTFRDCEDLAFDLQNDPDEQVNLLKDEAPPAPSEVETLRASLCDGFDYDKVLDNLQEQRRVHAEAFSGRVSPKTSNQILLGDGRLVDADMHLEYPNVVSERPYEDFDDWSESRD